MRLLSSPPPTIQHKLVTPGVRAGLTPWGVYGASGSGGPGPWDGVGRYPWGGAPWVRCMSPLPLPPSATPPTATCFHTNARPPKHPGNSCSRVGLDSSVAPALPPSADRGSLKPVLTKAGSQWNISSTNCPGRKAPLPPPYVRAGQQGVTQKKWILEVHLWSEPSCICAVGCFSFGVDSTPP